MSRIIGGFATSHAAALMEPEQWDEFRERIRRMYADRHGHPAPERNEIARETLEWVGERFAPIRATQDLVIRRLRDTRPDAVILIGNDQDENFGSWGAPQFAIYTGAEAVVNDWLSGSEATYPCAQDLAKSILKGCVAAGFDVVQTTQFKGQKLTAHAHSQVFRKFIPDADIPIIPVFVNAITPPYATPIRCFDFGRALRTAIEEDGKSARVVIGTSGGLSHFTASYPYADLTIPRGMGEICVDFDEGILSWLRAGELANVAAFNNQDLLDHGDVEFRQGITFLGALRPGSKPERLEYQAFYRGLMGFWAGYWEQ